MFVYTAAARKTVRDTRVTCTFYIYRSRAFYFFFASRTNFLLESLSLDDRLLFE